MAVLPRFVRRGGGAIEERGWSYFVVYEQGYGPGQRAAGFYQKRFSGYVEGWVCMGCCEKSVSGLPDAILILDSNGVK